MRPLPLYRPPESLLARLGLPVAQLPAETGGVRYPVLCCVEPPVGVLRQSVFGDGYHLAVPPGGAPISLTHPAHGGGSASPTL